MGWSDGMRAHSVALNCHHAHPAARNPAAVPGSWRCRSRTRTLKSNHSHGWTADVPCPNAGNFEFGVLQL